MMNVLAFAASNSSRSINKQIVGYATRLLDAGLIGDVSTETIDLEDYEMPIYSIDRERAGGIPRAAHDFFTRIGEADAVIISFAEHNGLYTAAYKNLFDWTSRIDVRVYQDKPAVLFSASPGQGGGGNVLNTAVSSGRFFGYDVTASLAIPRFQENFDAATGTLAEPELDTQFRNALITLGTQNGATS